MLSINAIEYYKNEYNSLKKLDGYFDFFRNNNLKLEKLDLVSKILSSTAVNQGSDVHFCLPRNGTDEVIRNNYEKKYKSFVKQFEFNEFAKTIREVEIDYHNNSYEYNYYDENIRKFVNELNDILSFHEKLVRSMYSNPEKVNFFDRLEGLILNYEFVVGGIEGFINSLTNSTNEIATQGVEEFTIQLLDVQYNLSDFANILNDLSNAYSTLQGIKKDYDFKKLEIVKIESGSLFAKIIGDPIVVAVLIYTIEKIIDIVYRKYSTEGKVDLNAKELQNISSSLETLDILKKNKINVKKQEKELNQCLNVAIHDLHKIVVKSPKIKINGKKYTIGEAQELLNYTQKYLECGKKIDKK